MVIIIVIIINDSPARQDSASTRAGDFSLCGIQGTFPLRGGFVPLWGICPFVGDFSLYRRFPFIGDFFLYRRFPFIGDFPFVGAFPL